MRGLRSAPVIVALALSICAAARGEWSIVMVDTLTGEVAVAAAACDEGVDLMTLLPVVVVDVGVATTQGLVDSAALHRLQIRGELIAGRSPEGIVHLLSEVDAAHANRQYGFAGVRRGAGSFTGPDNIPYADGAIGQVDTLRFAVQGNRLAGAAVIDAAAQAIEQTPGGLPDKLIAAMEAARAMGGDGRCSCDDQTPDACGAPPAEFAKSAHVAFVIVARTGDMDGPCFPDAGCATGDYFLNLNIADQLAGDQDPVDQLRGAFTIWRSFLLGNVDAVASSATVDPAWIAADGGGSSRLTIVPRDLQGDPAGEPIPEITVRHAVDSAGISTIGSVTGDGAGSYTVELTAGPGAGLDRFEVIVDDSYRPVTLMPSPILAYVDAADADHDLDVDRADYDAVALCLTGPDVAPDAPCAQRDLNADGWIDLRDVAGFQRRYTAEACRDLFIDIPPQPMVVSCDAESFTLDVVAFADPSPRYQWYIDGEPISGATGPAVTGSPNDSDDLGVYRVRVSNTCGDVTSAPAEVSTLTPCP